MESNRLKVILESLRQTEELQKSQLTISLAYDARAMTFCGLMLTAASLLAGLADTSGFTVAMYVAAAVLYVSAGLTGWSAMPVNWFAPGQTGAGFDDDISSNREFEDVALEMIKHNDKYIAHNEAVRKKQNQRLRWSAGVAIAAAPAGLAVQGVICAVF